MQHQGRVTERTFYPQIIEVIRQRGGRAVSEVSYNSEPDIVFQLLERDWLLGVKIGETASILKSAFIDYHRHKEESSRNHGLLLFLPEAVRRTPPTEEGLAAALASSPASCLVDTPTVRTELRGMPFPQILVTIINEVGPQLAKRPPQAYPLPLVISLLQQHVRDLMGTISLSQDLMLKIITDSKLLAGLGRLAPNQSEQVTRFLASYIFLSQILFLRLLSTANPADFPPPHHPISHTAIRDAFRRVLNVNYRPIYEVNILDVVSDQWLKDTFDLIWGLEVERHRFDLPGRIFHQLMPLTIRKMLAAFYTRPQAADILSALTIENSDATVFDPASGSGTILAATYRRKRDLFNNERRVGNPHRRFCEEEIFGADIMPFAVHLTSANLAAMDPATKIGRTQVIQGDSLKLSRGLSYQVGLQLELLPTSRPAATAEGETYDVALNEVDCILMNPPFTKVERGIQQYVHMSRFNNVVGGEVGLWGHFLPLAHEFLKEDGMLGLVLPINILRGRESARVREFIFSKWTPLYILKPTLNYGFSEWSEYRDILLVARKRPAQGNHQVRFCLIKQDLKDLTLADTHFIAQTVASQNSLRSKTLDIESFALSDLRARFDNVMWFCAGADLTSRDLLVSFSGKFHDHLRDFPARHFREGYRPVPKGVSSFLFLTRALKSSRVEEAFLRFAEEDQSQPAITAVSPSGTGFDIERDALTHTLRTGIGIKTMSIQGKWDYIAKRPYRAHRQVLAATGFQRPSAFRWERFWQNVQSDLTNVETTVVVTHRINPYSPNTYLIAFRSEDSFSPSNVLNVIKESDPLRAKAICVLLNSALFLSQFFLLKEETTGRYINIRFYDLEQMRLYPTQPVVEPLAAVFDAFAEREFPSLRQQLDQAFEDRYADFWNPRRSGQLSLLSLLRKGVEPARVRLDLDLAVCNALGMRVSEDELRQVYSAIVNDMVITRGLQRD